LQPEQAMLLDGSILDNKPLLAAIHAIRTHGAYREADRRLVYIDPHPDPPDVVTRVGTPGFFATLRGALSDLPRNDPIHAELEETSRFNDQIRRMKAIIRNSAPHVEALINQATGGKLTEPLTLEKLRHWRLTSTNLLANLSLVYNAWMRSLVLEAVDVISNLIGRVCRFDPRSQQAHWIHHVIEAWCEIKGMFPENYRIPDSVGVDEELPAFGQFIVNYGVKYKIRRISMILQQVNLVYRMSYEDGAGGSAQDNEIDQVKRAVDECLKPLLAIEEPTFTAGIPVKPVEELFGIPREIPMPDPSRYARDNVEGISQVLALIGDVCRLLGNNEELDLILSSPTMMALKPSYRRTILNGYLGWPYWDVMMLPVMSALGLDSSAFEEVLVDRISPNDARTICIDAECGKLRGAAVIGFGGFLSQSARENDYLWGRIHGIDRLFDLVASAVDPEQARGMLDVSGLKKRAFDAMLAEEQDRLTAIPEVLRQVRAALDRL
jgi:patatin-related protein